MNSSYLTRIAPGNFIRVNSEIYERVLTPKEPFGNGNRNVNGWYDEYNDWKTYEEALEIGLQEALKLLSDEFY